MICNNCKKPISDDCEICPFCGAVTGIEEDIEEDIEETSQVNLITLRKFCVWLMLIISITLVCAGIGFTIKAYNKKNDYSYENRYVGGDAYNYVINGTYFTGYANFASGCFISSAVLFCGAIIVGFIPIKKD